MLNAPPAVPDLPAARHGQVRGWLGTVLEVVGTQRPRFGRRRDPATLALVALLTVAAVLRGVLIYRGWPVTNSDEGTIGIMALHIADGRGFPTFFYGQSYMGSGQAVVGAALFTVFGPSLAMLRTGMLLMFLAFLVLLYRLGRDLYGTRVALVAVALLVPASREGFGLQLVAIGGMPETLLAGTALLLIGHRVMAAGGDLSAARYRWSLAGWGAVAMLGLWSSMLVAPFALTSALLLWWGRTRRGAAGRVPRAGLALSAGLLAGAAPIIAHDLTSPLAKGWLPALVGLYSHGGTAVPGELDAGSLPQRLWNTAVTSLAYVTGGSSASHQGDPPAWPKYWPGWAQPTGTAPGDAIWGLALVGLWAVAVVATVRRIRGDEAPGDPRMWSRLALLAAAALTFVAFGVSRAAGLSPANHSRYLIGVLIATPAIVHALLRLPPLSGLLSGRSPVRRDGPAWRWILPAVAVAVLSTGTAAALRESAQPGNADPTPALADALRARGVTHIYTEYWTCNRLAFVSREDIICAVVGVDPAGRVRHGTDRYRPYRGAVLAAEHAAYVLPSQPSYRAALARLAGCTWRTRSTVLGYEVWQPDGRCVPLPDK